MKILMKGPQIHPSYLNSLTQVFPEHTFHLTGYKDRTTQELKLTDFTYLYPMQANVKIEIPWDELIQIKNWQDNYDLFIGDTEGTQPQELEKYTIIPKIWRTFSILDFSKVPILGGPIIFNSYTSRNFAVRECRKHEVLTRDMGKYVAYDYKNPAIYKGWTGDNPNPLIVTHNFFTRGAVGNELYQKLDPKIKLNVRVIDGNLPFQDLLKAYREHRVFLELTQGGRLITGTIMEAMMIGMPVIATPEADFPMFVRPWIEGFLSDDPARISHFADFLSYDYITAQDMGHNARMRALELCSYSSIRAVWEDAIHEVTKPGVWSEVGRRWG